MRSEGASRAVSPGLHVTSNTRLYDDDAECSPGAFHIMATAVAAASSSSSSDPTPPPSSIAYRDMCYLHPVTGDDTFNRVSLQYNTTSAILQKVNCIRPDYFDSLPNHALLVVPRRSDAACVEACRQLCEDDEFLKEYGERLPPVFRRRASAPSEEELGPPISALINGHSTPSPTSPPLASDRGAKKAMGWSNIKAMASTGMREIGSLLKKSNTPTDTRRRTRHARRQ